MFVIKYPKLIPSFHFHNMAVESARSGNTGNSEMRNMRRNSHSGFHQGRLNLDIQSALDFIPLLCVLSVGGSRHIFIIFFIIGAFKIHVCLPTQAPVLYSL